jgi:hypothetical protein
VDAAFLCHLVFHEGVDHAVACQLGLALEVCGCDDEPRSVLSPMLMWSLVSKFHGHTGSASVEASQSWKNLEVRLSSQTYFSACNTLHGFVMCVLVGVVVDFKSTWLQGFSNLLIS